MIELVFAIVGFTALHVVNAAARAADSAAWPAEFLWAFSALHLDMARLSLDLHRADVWITGPIIRRLSAFVMLGVITMMVLAVTQKPPVLLTAETVLRSDNALRGVVRITRHPLMWAVGIGGCIYSTMPIRRAGCSSAIARCWALGGTWLIGRRLLGDRWPLLAIHPWLFSMPAVWL